MRLLVAESDVTIAKICTWFFLREGYEVETVADAFQCERGIRERLPDLLILEYELPRGGAVGVLEKVANEPGGPSLPVILSSYSEIPESLQRHQAPPVVGCLLKPYRLKVLADLVQSVLEPPSDPMTFSAAHDQLVAVQPKTRLTSFLPEC